MLRIVFSFFVLVCASQKVVSASVPTVTRSCNVLNRRAQRPALPTVNSEISFVGAAFQPRFGMHRLGRSRLESCSHHFVYTSVLKIIIERHLDNGGKAGTDIEV